VAVDSVEVRTRVAGTLEGVHFKDGQTVAKGDLLFSIDRRPFENTLAQARANVVLARSNLTFADTDLARAAQLVRDKAISEQVYDQRSQTKRNAEASVAASEAAARQAELDLEFTEVRAPVAGRIGDRRVSPGNLVASGAGATLLATIVSTNPMRFEFTFDEASLLRYDRVARQNADQPAHGLTLPVKLRLIDEKEFTHQGAMDFVDNVIERGTGTIRGRAVFDNKRELFVPGMFGRVQVPAGPPSEALLVPDSAVGTDQARKFVFVVEADGTAKQTYVSLGQAVGDKRVVRDGLTPDSAVVVNGLMRVRPGIKVTPQEEGAVPAASGTPTAAK
jgi:RND family efflux transporter MFP subunit